MQRASTIKRRSVDNNIKRDNCLLISRNPTHVPLYMVSESREMKQMFYVVVVVVPCVNLNQTNPLP